ncbi:hypothetical protein EV127DRAFT_480647 [Xylaria flabelliformis]|nr:hypothetical protein EV127DRAFT_480647 [Xylaria flabelliformis]
MADGDHSVLLEAMEETRQLLSLVLSRQAEQSSQITSICGDNADILKRCSGRATFSDINELRQQNKQSSDAIDRLQRETRALRKQIDNLCNTLDCVPRFTGFRRLPPEIRHKIWDLALPRKILRFRSIRWTIKGEPMSGNILEEESISTIPSVAQACREAMAIATLTGALRGVQTPTMNSGPNNPFRLDNNWSQRGSRYNKTQWSWYDASRDTLKISSDFRFYPDFDIRHITQVTQHVLADSFNDSYLVLYIRRLFNPNLFPSLQTVSFIFDHIRLRRSVDSATQVRVFGLDGGCQCLIDVEDLDKIKELELERDPKKVEGLRWELLRCKEDESEADESKAEKSECSTTPTWTWDGFQRQLAERWHMERSLRARKHPFVISPSHVDIGLMPAKPPDNSTILGRLPRFRRVVLLSMPDKDQDGPLVRDQSDFSDDGFEDVRSESDIDL